MYSNIDTPAIESANSEYLDRLSAGLTKRKSHPRFVNFERRLPGPFVFDVDDKTTWQVLPRPSHWSIAWSDLMMTMFVLFLSMFTYQMAHQQFLRQGEPEIIGGEATDALETVSTDRASMPFDPIVRGLPLITAGTIKKVEPAQAQLPAAPAPAEPEGLDTPPAPIVKAEETAPKIRINPPEIVYEPRPLLPEPAPEPGESFQEIYAMSKVALDSNKLGNFAAIDLIPDKTMRIILTGDLLFGTGESELSNSAKTSLRKLTGYIKDTPYMINIVGHTDNVPMHSYKYASNWELSVSRAATVARFLMEDIGMNPNQFVVSGYSSFRPVVPNVSAENRSRNRRVEIIISKKLPLPLPMDPQEFNRKTSAEIHEQ
jgi:chemotaxis protein MotB